MPSDKKGITVRFEDEEMDRISELAKRYNVNVTTVIRWAINALYDYVQANGGKITLPLDFSKIYEVLEARGGEMVAARKPVKYPTGRELRSMPPSALNEEPEPKTNRKN